MVAPKDMLHYRSGRLRLFSLQNKESHKSVKILSGFRCHLMTFVAFGLMEVSGLLRMQVLTVTRTLVQTGVARNGLRG